MPELSQVLSEAAAGRKERTRRIKQARQALFPERAIKLARRLLASPIATKATHDTPESTKDLLRQSVHIVAMTDDPEYRKWFQQMERDAELPERTRRLREIWGAIIEHDSRRTLPIHLRIKATPRVRGCGAAARRAGF